MSAARASRLQLVVVMTLLIVLHFYIRPRLWNARVSPDFLTLGLVIYATRSRPGAGAVAGFLVGLMADALTPARFGAATLACTVVGYVAAWGRAVFFADNLLVNAGFVVAGVWLRDLIVLLASGTTRAAFFTELFVYSPLQGLVTAVFGVLLLIAFREWFAIRLDQ